MIPNVAIRGVRGTALSRASMLFTTKDWCTGTEWLKTIHDVVLKTAQRMCGHNLRVVTVWVQAVPETYPAGE